MPVCQECGNKGHEKDTTKFKQHGMQYAWDKPPRFSCRFCGSYLLKWTFKENSPDVCFLIFFGLIVIGIISLLLLSLVIYIFQVIELAMEMI